MVQSLMTMGSFLYPHKGRMAGGKDASEDRQKLLEQTSLWE